MHITMTSIGTEEEDDAAASIRYLLGISCNLPYFVNHSHRHMYKRIIGRYLFSLCHSPSDSFFLSRGFTTYMLLLLFRINQG